MSNYRLTSSDFVTPGESLVPDAVMAHDDLASLKQTAGGLAGFLQAQIANRIANNTELPEGNTIIIREQKYDNDN